MNTHVDRALIDSLETSLSNSREQVMNLIRERDEARERLASAEAELDSVADAIGTIRLDTAIGPSQKDAIMDVITHIDRFLRANRGVRK